MIVVASANARAALAPAVETLRAGCSAGITSQEWVVFVGPEGGYQFIAGYSGSLDSLQWDKGAARAWRLSRSRNHLVVEGRSAAGRCVIEEQAPPLKAAGILPRVALYRI